MTRNLAEERFEKAMWTELEAAFRKQAEGADGMHGEWKKEDYLRKYIEGSAELGQIERLATQMSMFHEYWEIRECVIMKLQAEEREKEAAQPRRFAVQGPNLEEPSQSNANGYGELVVEAHTAEEAIEVVAGILKSANLPTYGLWVNPERQVFA